MRKIVFAVFMLITTCILYATEDYRGGNGTILRQERIGDKEIEVRKFEISDYAAGLWFIDDYTIYDDYIRKNKIGTLVKDKGYDAVNSYVLLDFYETCFISEDKNDPRGDLWVKVSDKKITGWVHADSSMRNPYANENYSYLGTIGSEAETYYIRKYNDILSWWKWKDDSHSWSIDDTLQVREKPGKQSRIIAEITAGPTFHESPDVTIHYFNSEAITEEYVYLNHAEEKDNECGYWVKIEYEKSKFGWVSSNYFRDIATPEYIILNQFDTWICPY